MSESKIKDDNYYLIQGWMINKLGLKGVPLNVYAIIYGFSQDGDNEYTGGLQYLCDFCGGVSRPTIISALKTLIESGYIICHKEIINGVQFNRYKISLLPVKKFNGGSKEILQGGSKEILPNNKDINNKSYDNKNNNKNIYAPVVEYLNEKAGTKYKPSNKVTQRHINARVAEGYTLDDFKTVIDKKVTEWKGTTMEQYLRPETLFGSKFENYLNATIQPRNGQKVIINGEEYIYNNGNYYIPNGTGIAVDPYADNDLPY